MSATTEYTFTIMLISNLNQMTLLSLCFNLPSKLASLWIEELTVSFSCLTAAEQKEKTNKKLVSKHA